MSSDEEELFLVAALLEEQEREELLEHRRYKRRFSIHPINMGRQLHGEFHTLFNQLSGLASGSCQII